MEYAAVQLAVAKTTPSAVAPPLGSATVLAWPLKLPETRFSALLALKAIAGGSPKGAGFTIVPSEGVPETKGPVGTVQRCGLTSSSKVGGWPGYGPLVEEGTTSTVPRVLDPGASGGMSKSVLSVKQ
jgi:hypothetical protein